MTDSAIEIRGLEKTFKPFNLGPLDMTVPQGAIYGFIGPNGAGKTTTIDLIMGMGKKEAGSIRVLGLDHLEDEVEMKLQVGYVSPDLNYTPWGRVGKVITFIRGFYPDWDDDYCRSLLDRLGIGWSERIGALSFGARIKLSLILALSRHPRVLLLDEPTVGLDAVSKQEVFSELLAAVQDENHTVLISSHGLSDIERFCDHIGMIKEGKMLLEGSTTDIVERYRMVDFVTANGTDYSDVRDCFVQKRDGNRIRALLDVKGHALDDLRTRGASEITMTPVTLEELFVGLARGKE